MTEHMASRRGFLSKTLIAIFSPRFRIAFLCPVILLITGALQHGLAGAPDKSPRQIATIQLPGVRGRIDHLTAAPAARRLFVAALGNNSVEFVDIATDKYMGRLTGLNEPQGLAFDDKSNQLFAAEGEGASLDIYDASSLKKKQTIKNLPDADNVRLDSKQNAVLVAYGEGAIAQFDAQSGKKSAEIKLDAHPESFRLDDSRNLIYANVPHDNEVVVIDRKSLKIQAHWHLPAAANYPMALAGNRLFIACRRPASLVIIDLFAGKILQTLPMSGDCDDLFYDGAAQRLYASCGEGFLNVFEQQQNDQVKLTLKIPTRAGARTSVYVPSLNRLYIAAPRTASKAAEILVFDVQQ